ncbi:type I toxin-antitoxin system SymE family toxin [Trinickia terrae]|uniref:Type I toxin-antitoxin system SymE family toxin n=2 Tax=Trinickia terrae TaxID=2571161 RepID=A0A4V5PJ30_9BURK|nr:SymE family type I addiction module toxin [Trinickia terrae]TKC89810.1 type I toxin-antitoxin system SymE family toxin [Trinickia terrae]
MANTNVKAGSPLAERFVTVQQSRRYRPLTTAPRRTTPPTFPWLKLAGRWIEQAGFKPHQRVRVTVEHGRLIITAA